jgi:phage N-6-adenine-methyltransferase
MMDTCFERVANGKDEWLTPPEIIKALGPFDLDPCAPVVRPWDTAARHFTVNDDGLAQEWTGRVWCNPPYGNKTGLWMSRMTEHGNGILLVFARTETENFFRFVWDKADAILFIRGRIQFRKPDGSEIHCNAGAPSCLVAYGLDNADDLSRAGIAGKFIWLK